jgi:hypothetical protein
VVGVDAHQVGDVGLETVPKIQLGAVRVLLDEHGVAVLRLRETIELVLGARRLAGFEDEAELGAEKRELGKIGAGGCNGEVERFPRGQNAVAQVEPKRFASPGFTLNVKSSMSRIGQSGSFTWMLRRSGRRASASL